MAWAVLASPTNSVQVTPMGQKYMYLQWGSERECGCLNIRGTENLNQARARTRINIKAIFEMKLNHLSVKTHTTTKHI